jgi:helix-turn-helix protein
MNAVIQWRKQLRDSDLSTSTKCAGFVLSTYMNANGYCHVTRSTLAKGMSCEIRTVDRQIRELETHGWLVVMRTKGGTGINYVNRFTAATPLSLLAAHSGDTTDTASSDENDPQRRQKEHVAATPVSPRSSNSENLESSPYLKQSHNHRANADAYRARPADNHQPDSDGPEHAREFLQRHFPLKEP